ncbi:hypothetical protein PL8927_600158 [Planktothrix serta PCC 8927]|uniref:Uncharacterized protein n=1 Tax=Planktothrix serta PCC 8927 TaxID=671068 RepID=A0A7Z9BPX9_9CYAN|nr:hypothetical protein PL8927_600158 [Planktothrix serta PCC 8927]
MWRGCKTRCSLLQKAFFCETRIPRQAHAVTGEGQIQIKPCGDDPLLVKSETKVSIKYLACLGARPSVSRESVHYHKLRFTLPSDQVRTQRCWRW